MIGIEAAKEIVHMRLNLQEGKSYKCVAFITHLGMVTPEARSYLSHEGYEAVEKLALITSSQFNTVMGNIFIHINKPIRPTRIFRNLEEGLKWLRKNDQ